MNEELAGRDKKIEALTRKPEDDQEEEEMETASGESKFRINPKAATT